VITYLNYLITWKNDFYYLILESTTQNDLQDIISGKSQVRFGAIIQTIADYLKKSTAASAEIKRNVNID
jgi:hypothetical protein